MEVSPGEHQLANTVVNRERLLSLAAKILVAALFVGGLIFRIHNAWLDVDHLSHTTVPDDTYYYLSIARHVALGHPPSIDGLHATNGYHPLWLVILVAMFQFPFHDSYTPVHVALTIGALLDTAAGLCLLRVALQLGLGRAARIFVVGAFMLNPFQVIHATCGLETPLALLLALLLFSLWLGQGRDVRSLGSPWLFGALGGLALLARTDQIFLFASLLVAQVVRARGRNEPGGVLAALLWCAKAVVTAAILLIPWFVYSYRTCGTVVQSSGLALSIVVDSMPRVWGFQEQSLAMRVARLAASAGEGNLWVTRFLGWGEGLGQLGTPCVVVFGLLTYALVPRATRGELRASLLQWAPFAAGMLALFLAHTLGRHVFREWYTAPIGVAIVLSIALFLDPLLSGGNRLWVGVVAVLGAIWWGSSMYQWTHDTLYTGGQLSRMRPASGLHEGHTDCGAVSYYAEEGITNLDGIVNEAAFESLRRGRLLDYVTSEHFDRIYASDYYHSDVFFGVGYREHLRGETTDPRAVRVVGTDAEKDEVIRLGEGAINLGGQAGREYLSDGWQWFPTPAEDDAASSLGVKSTLIFYTPTSLVPDSEVQFEMSATDVDDSGAQRVDVRLDGKRVRSLRVRQKWAWYRVPVGGAGTGRHRIELAYGSPTAHRGHGWGWFRWWRLLDGNPLRAVLARGIRLRSSRADDVAGACAFLRADQEIYFDEPLRSCDGRFVLRIQDSDGILALDRGNAKLWSPDPIAPGKRAAFAIMQGDGNFVLYTATREVIWASRTDGNPGAHLRVQDDGNVVIMSSSGAALWETKTASR